jgi:methionyl-tRNA formyltransferase
MRIAFMGTPEFAVPTLEALVEAGHDIAAVYTQPPRPAARGKALQPTPVHLWAEAKGLEVRHPLTLRDADEQAAFAALGLDVAVVAAYGLILPVPVLEAPRLGCLNVHGSLLPRWRGAAPVQRAILAGDVETGVGIMQMEKGLDTGPVRLEGRVRIDHKTAGTVTTELAALGAALMLRVLANPDDFTAVPQAEGGVTYAAKIEKAEARIDFTRSATEIERHVRAFNPAPGAFFEFGGERIQLLTVAIDEATGAPGEILDDALIACGEGAIRPLMVKRAGRGAMTTAELLRGFPIPKGTILA